MAGDGLFDPLGVGRVDPVRRFRVPSAPVAVAILGVAAVSALVVVAWWRDDGDRGRSRAVAPIDYVVAPPKPPMSVPPVPPAPGPASDPGIVAPGLPPPSEQEVEIQNGVRIIRPRRDPAVPSGQILPPQAAAPAHEGR